MQLNFLKSKIHRAKVTEARLDYEGSLTIDQDLMEAADMAEYEKIDVLNINNGERFTTYVIKGERGSGVICINGAAARLAQVGDLVIICTYAQLSKEQAAQHKPLLVMVDEDNKKK